MLGFLDESGDTGLKVASGSSRFFVVALVVFDDDNEALRCDRRIDLLRQEMRLAATYEFRFARNSRGVREAFLRVVAAFDFKCFEFALDKSPEKVGGLRTDIQRDLFSYVAARVVDSAATALTNATIVMDRRGNRRTGEALRRQLRSAMGSNEGYQTIRRVRQQDSHRNNLLQLADYVAGVARRSLEDEVGALDLRERFLRQRTVSQEIWPS